MKKFVLGAIGLMALGMAAPASAADLAARPYTKAPPPVVAPVYDWTGFYIGGNGGWGESHNCVDFVTVGGTFASGCRRAVGRRSRRTNRISLANQSICLWPGSARRLGRPEQYARQPSQSGALNPGEN